MKISNIKKINEIENEAIKRFEKKDRKKKYSMKVSGASVKRLANIISKKG